ncbi:MAG: hypothetical protein ACRENL_07145 [Candidatus Dormibacteria bacterium]
MTSSRRAPLRALARVLAVVPVLAAGTVVGSVTGVGPHVAGCAQASSVHHAALVAEHASGAAVTVCVAFAGDSITGAQLLARSGVEYATADYGGTGQAVCQIDSEPAQYPSSCWTASSPYWAMFVSRGGGAWTVSSLGISSQTFRDSDALGFRYQGQSDYASPPSPRGVCPAVSSSAPTPMATVQAGGAAHPARSSSASTSRPTAAAAAISPTATIVEPSPSTGEGSAAPAHVNATTVRGRPAAPALGMSTGAWAAASLVAVLLVLLAVQLTRARRRRPPARRAP